MSGAKAPGLTLACAALLLAGCADSDPYRRPGMWKPTGANTLNLAAMIDRPADLVQGRGTRGNPAIEAATPVAHYWAGKPNPLPSSSAQTAVSVNVNNNNNASGDK